MKKPKTTTTIHKIRYQIDNPMGRELDAFFEKSRGKELNAEFKAAAIRGLVLNRNWNSDKIEVNGKELTIFVEFIRQRAAANDRAFFKSLGRALTEERKFRNAEIEDFLFKNWDATHGTVIDGPGLKHFIDEAVVELLQIRFGDSAPSLQAYREIRKTAALVPDRPAKIRHVDRDPESNSIRLFPS
jgi:hypothetical protein